MDALYPAIFVVLGFSAGSVLLSWFYFRRYAITRPPIGVFNFTDIAFMIVGIVLVPYLYLVLPLWLVAGLLTVGTLSILYFLWEPMLRPRLLVSLVSLVMVGADIWASLQFGAASNQFFAINNVVMLASVVGLTNLWAQSGMNARDVSILGGFLAVYDLTATWLLPLMLQMMTRLAGLPFSPMVGWSVEGVGGVGDGGVAGIGSSGLWVTIGLGDLLLAAVFPLVMRKAFGRAAGLAALLIALPVIAAIMLLPIAAIFPVMIVLGPLMIIQYAYWSRKCKQERTTWEYLQAEPLYICGEK